MTVQELQQKASNLRIAVIGDYIIDEYRIGKVTRRSAEADVPILRQQDIQESPGGAGNVFYNLMQMGVRTDLYCRAQLVSEESVMSNGSKQYFDQYPCARKIRMMEGDKHLLRVDVEIESDQIEWPQFQDFSWSRELLDEFVKYDVIVMSDYRKGVLSDNVINTILDIANELKILIIVDAKDEFDRFYNAEIVKCNRAEWNGAHSVAMTFKTMIVTDGPDGMSSSTGLNGEWQVVYGHKVEVVDVCGAGDTVTAMLAICKGLKMTTAEAMQWANIAAAAVCTRAGVQPIDVQLLETTLKACQ